jgi:hypothetical protein
VPDDIEVQPRERSPERAHEHSAERSPEQGEIARLTVLLTAADARAEKADLRADRAEHRAEQAEQRADAAILRADAADADRRTAQARVDAAEGRAGRAEDRATELRERLDAAELAKRQAEEAAELARSQAAHAHKSVAEQLTGRGRPPGGDSEIARELGISRQELHRAEKISGRLSREAWDEATRRDLNNATRALMRAAEHSDPAEQVRVIQEEYIRRLRTPGSCLGPRRTGPLPAIVITERTYLCPILP